MILQNFTTVRLTAEFVERILFQLSLLFEIIQFFLFWLTQQFLDQKILNFVWTVIHGTIKVKISRIDIFYCNAWVYIECGIGYRNYKNYDCKFFFRSQMSVSSKLNTSIIFFGLSCFSPFSRVLLPLRVRSFRFCGKKQKNFSFEASVT